MELLSVLQDVRVIQEHSGNVLPLLVDEKIHYAINKLMYSVTFKDYNVPSWLAQVPLEYGVWHPYKHAVTLVYRKFFPVFALLESTGLPTLGASIRVHR